jgi:hypothetical protein
MARVFSSESGNKWPYVSRVVVADACRRGVCTCNWSHRHAAEGRKHGWDKELINASGNFEPPARELRQGCSHIRLFTDEGVVPAGAGAGASVAG